MRNIFEHIEKIIGCCFEEEQKCFMETVDKEVTVASFSNPDKQFTEEQKKHIFYSVVKVYNFVNSDFSKDFKNLLDDIEADVDGDFRNVEKKNYYTFLTKYKDLVK